MKKIRNIIRDYKKEKLFTLKKMKYLKNPTFRDLFLKSEISIFRRPTTI